MEITPRFHELGSSKKNNNMIDFNTNKKSNSSEILEIYENENKCSEVKIHTDFLKVYVKNILKRTTRHIGKNLSDGCRNRGRRREQSPSAMKIYTRLFTSEKTIS